MASIRESIANWINPPRVKTTPSVASWFLNFRQMAADEDSASATITIDGAYKSVAWVNIAVSTRARTLARAPFELLEGDNPVETGNAWELFNHGLAGKSRYQIWEETEGWRCLRGEAIWILGWGGLGGFPKQIVIVDPELMKDKRDPATRKITLWVYDDGQTRIPFDPKEIIHFPNWNPFDPLRGLSEILPLKEEVAQEWLGSRAQTNLIANSSIPGGVITIPGDEMSAEDAQRTIEQWEKRHKGSTRVGKVSVLGSGATYQRISLTPEEAQSFETRGWNRETILAKLGVPRAAAMLQSEGSTLSGKDTEEQMRAFWQFTLIPELRYFEDKLESDFFYRFGLQGMSGKFNLEEIQELQTDAAELSTREAQEIASGRRTINEIREAHGEDPVPWGDTWWKPLGLEPADIALETAKNPPEPESVPEQRPPQGQEADEEESPKEPAKSVRKGRPRIYTPAYRDAHWKAIVGPWEKIEAQYTKKLKSWVYEIRSDELERLHKLMAQGNFRATVQAGEGMDLLIGEPMWDGASLRLQEISKPFFLAAVNETSDELLKLFADIGISVGGSWSIWDTRAKELLATRVTKVSRVSDNVKERLRVVLGDALEGGWSEQELADKIEAGFKTQFNITQNRAQYIARTELGGVINESRNEAFKEVGIKRHEWLSAQDERVRDTHRIDGETRPIGERFSNGLLYPNDPGGPAEEVINCRCLSLPVFEE